MIKYLIVMGVLMLLSVALGFWMGRHTVEKPVNILPVKGPGGAPKFDEDPWQEAMADKKTEGSL